MTFIEILNDPKFKKMVEAIEDTQSSLHAYPDGEATLERILDQQIDELFVATGYRYDTHN
jgi:hypothetical protein